MSLCVALRTTIRQHSDLDVDTGGAFHYQVLLYVEKQYLTAIRAQMTDYYTKA